MAILLNNNGYDNGPWQVELAKHLPHMPVYIYPDIPDPDKIQYALVWNHPKGDLNNYKNLQAVLSLGAGVEHFANDPNLPNVPVVRLVDPAVAEDMAMHTLYWVMNFHRHYHRYANQQVTARWQRHTCLPASDFHVGILGLGNIGGCVAKKIADNGYPVSGWDLSGKQQGNLTLGAVLDN